MQITSRPYEAYLHKETDFESLYGDEIEYEMEGLVDKIKYEEGELAVFKCRPAHAIREVRLRTAFMRKAKAKRDKKNIC